MKRKCNAIVLVATLMVSSVACADQALPEPAVQLGKGVTTETKARWTHEQLKADLQRLNASLEQAKEQYGHTGAFPQLVARF